MRSRRFLLPAIALSALLLLSACATKPDFTAESPNDIAGKPWTLSMAMEELGGDDPIEPFNRSMFCVNDVFMQYLVWPVAWVYGSILPEQVIRRIDMASDNLAFPGRMMSCFLQAKFKYGGTEFLRFLTNSTVGIGGFFDPADAWFGLRRRHENMGHAFAAWGIGPGCIFVLPGSTATNPRDQVGLLFDSVLDIKLIIPYAGTVSSVNRIIRSYDSYNALTESSPDVYETFKMAMLAMRYGQLNDLPDRVPENRVLAEYRPAPKPDAVPVARYFHPENELNDTLRVALFSMQDNDRSWWIKTSIWNTDFIMQGSKRSIRFSEELPRLRYRLWEKSSNGTLAVIVPGVGTHYTGTTISAFAELLNKNGYAVAVMSNSMNWSFAEAAGLSAPGYAPDDAARVREAIRKIVDDVRENTELKEFELVLAGYSLGGLHTLKIAEMERKEPMLNVKRYLAVNPPVDILRSMQRFDALAELSREWNRRDFFRNADEVMMKYLPLVMSCRTFAPLLSPEALEAENKRRSELEEPLPPLVQPDSRMKLDRIQAGVLIGLSFRMTMRELMMTLVRDGRVPEGAVKTPYSWFRRTALYAELDNISGMEYVRRFILPHYPGKSLKTLQYESSLYSGADSLKTDDKIRIVHNADDPILDGKEIRFLDETFGRRIIWFDCGGHMGNLYLKEFQDILLEQLK